MISPVFANFQNEIWKTITVQNLLSLDDPHTLTETAYELDLLYRPNTTLQILLQPDEQGPAIFIPSSLHKCISL